MDQRANYQKRVAAGKSILWRLVGIIYLWIIAYLTTGSVPSSTLITVIHHVIFLIVFFVQDQAWMRIEWGKDYYHQNIHFFGDWTEIKWKAYWRPTKWRSLVKGFVYEIVIATPILTLIAFIVTGNITTAVNTSIIYTTTKILLYQLYEQVFDTWFSQKV